MENKNLSPDEQTVRSPSPASAGTQNQPILENAASAQSTNPLTDIDQKIKYWKKVSSTCAIILFLILCLLFFLPDFSFF